MQAWITSPPPSLPGKGVAPRLYDSATASTLTLPREGGSRARLYVCGITPYDATHLGHARTYLTFDLLNRVWADAGYDVAYTQNVTDVDDPLLERARRDGVAWQQLAQQETDRFRSDMAALSVLPPTTFLGVTEAVDLIAGSVAELLRLSAAYELDGDIYFSLDADPHFGSVAHLSRTSMLELFAERGGDPEREGKKNPLDPLLWRAARPDEPSWDSSVGRGRPGWHIECTAIALSSLGMGIAVQGGGCDLTFPHHEMSASHASVLTEAHPFAQAYVHVGMVEYQGEKMSKSLGNLVFVSELLAAGTDPRAIRLSLIGRHHQHDFEWSAADLTAAEERLESWRTAVGRSAAPDARPLLDALRTSLANDLDAAAAMGEVDRWAQTPGNDPSAPGLAADAVSALLGIDLAA